MMLFSQYRQEMGKGGMRTLCVLSDAWQVYGRYIGIIKVQFCRYTTSCSLRAAYRASMALV